MRRAGAAFRPVAIGCGLAVLLQFVLGGKPYYPGAAYTFLLAAGCVPLERWLAARRPLFGRIRPVTAMAGGMLLSAAVVLPVALPVLPAAVLRTVPLQKINYDLAESIAWPKQVALVAREYDGLPPAQRRLTTILAGNYGEAGAIRALRRRVRAAGRPIAAPTTSGSGARRPRRTRRPSR